LADRGRDDYTTRRFRKNAEEVLKLGEGVSGTQLAEIVYDQHNDSGRFA